MKLLVGLGNPGPTYAGHRHNIGFMAVDAIAARHGFGPWRRRFRGQASEGRLAGETVLLLKPMTYMNESGRAVGEARRFHKLASGDIVVFHDEIDLAPGKVRVKTGGGYAGHNGLRSIAAQIGADFRRVRLGVGHPGDKARVQGYVLRDFAKADRAWLAPLLDAIADAAPHLAADADDKFMNAVALKVQAEPDHAPAGSAGPAPRKRKPRAGAPSAGKAPSQRDLARAASNRTRDARAQPDRGAGTEASATGEPGDSKLAALLRRFLGRP